MTGPAHCPDVTMKGNKFDSFSKACVAALAKCGYAPEDFGTYDDVRERIKQKRAECDLYDDFRRRPKGPPEGIPEDQRARRQAALDEHMAKKPRPPLSRPTPEDRRLSRSQSGHLSQNAAHQGKRGDVCSQPPSCRRSYVPPSQRRSQGWTLAPGGGYRSESLGAGCHGTPGYRDNKAPCMPHQGQAARDGTGHNHVTCQECDAAAQQGAQQGESAPGTPYSRAQEERDADARTESLLNEHGNGLPPPTQETDAGDAASEANPKSSDAAKTASGAGAGAPTTPNAGAIDSAAASKAADCINQFRKAMQQAMAQQCIDDKDKNAAAAGSPTSRDRLRKERDKRQREVDRLEAQDPQDAAALEEARAERNKAASAHGRAQSAACMVEQAEALEASGGVPTTDCRTPSLWQPPPNWTPPTSTGGAQPATGGTM